MMNLLIGVGIFIVLIIVLCGYLGVNIGSGFLSMLGIAIVIIIGFLLVVHYGGKSSQTMNPPADGEWHRTPDGWIRSGEW